MMAELAEYARQFDYIVVFFIFVYAMVGACAYTITEGIFLIVDAIRSKAKKRREKKTAADKPQEKKE
ncbi:MAG: hypothetical protein IJT94_09290 [Oscillibacter sp.]|nr:hypothetical protein [Oscillibacter sp.]